MRYDFPDKDIIGADLRLLMRSRHIYILFSALIHLALGSYMTLAADGLRRHAQLIGSGLLAAASGLLIWGFVAETYYYLLFSEISRWGIYLSLAGVALHALASVRRAR